MIVELSIDGHPFIGSVSEAEDIIRRVADDVRAQRDELRSQLEAVKRAIAEVIKTNGSMYLLQGNRAELRPDA